MNTNVTPATGTRQSQIERLAAAVAELRREVLALDQAALTEPLGSWTPRDIVAHLVGWNDALIEGCRQLLRGELPFYDIDPGEDYGKVNAVFLRRHPSDDREVLLDALAASAERLQRFLTSLAPVDWDRDSGVMHGEERLTVCGTVDDLIDDYRHHSRQLAAWSAAR